MDDNNLKTEHGWYDSLKVIKAIEEHIREALRLSDSANLALSKELGDTLSSVIMSREAMEAGAHFGEDYTFDDADDDDQSDYFARAYDVLEANPDLKALYEKDPPIRLGEELWDIDNKNPNPRYTTLRDFISKHKFNVPVDRYSGKPDTEYLANVLALINNKDNKESTKNILNGVQGVM